MSEPGGLIDPLHVIEPSQRLDRELRLVTRIALCGRACLDHVCNHTLKAGPGPAQSGLSLVLGEGAGIITPISLSGEPRLRGVKRDTGSPTASTSWCGDLKGPVPQQGLRGAPVETAACPASRLPHRFSPSHRCSCHRVPLVSQPGHFLSPLGFTLCFLCPEHLLSELSFKVSSSRSGTLRTFGFCVPIASQPHLPHCNYTLLLYFLSRPGAVDDVKRENEWRGG